MCMYSAPHNGRIRKLLKNQQGGNFGACEKTYIYENTFKSRKSRAEITEHNAVLLNFLSDKISFQ